MMVSLLAGMCRALGPIMMCPKLGPHWKGLGPHLRPRLKPFENLACAQQTRTFFTFHKNKEEPYPMNPLSPEDWHRPPSICETALTPACTRPCFDITSVVIKEAWSEEHYKMAYKFLYDHYWPREPSVNSLYIPLVGNYLKMQTDIIMNGDKFMAFEMDECCNARMIGLLIGTKVTSNMVCEWEDWARCLTNRGEQNHLFFRAHCYKRSDIHCAYDAYNIYDLSVLATTPDVWGQCVGTTLLQYGISLGVDCGHKIGIVATSAYMQRIIPRIPGMTSMWTMPYIKFLDAYGHPVFCPRRPHNHVVVYGYGERRD